MFSLDLKKIVCVASRVSDLKNRAEKAVFVAGHPHAAFIISIRLARVDLADGLQRMATKRRASEPIQRSGYVMANRQPPILRPVDLDLVRRQLKGFGICLTDEDIKEVEANLDLLAYHRAVLDRSLGDTGAGGDAD